MSKGIYHFWDLLAIPSAYSAYLILKGKRTGVYLFLLCAILNLLTQVSLVSSSIIIQQIIDIPIFAIIMYVLFFRLKKNGKTAWSVLK